MSDRQTRRDTAFDRTLARALGRQPTPSDRCPDPETIAALWDRSLPSAERRTCEDHVARCSRCQARLAALVRTSRVEDDGGVMEPSGLHWLIDWRWLAPLATAAAVLLAVWVADPGSVAEQTAPTASDASSVGIADSGLPEPEEDLEPSLQERSDPQVATRENAPVETDALAAVDEVFPADRVPPATPAASAARPDLRDAALPTSSPVPTEELVERRLSVQSADARNVASPLRTARFEDTVATVVISPNPATRWRLAANAVEHSGDAGVTWTLQLTGIGGMLTAGSAPSTAVCWIVGRAGTVFRTVDGGETWEQVRAPTDTDLVAVEALDGQSATVDGIDATSFRTQDGGQSWTEIDAPPR